VAGQHGQQTMKMWPQFAESWHQFRMWQLSRQQIKMTSGKDQFRAFWKKICQCSMCVCA